MSEPRIPIVIVTSIDRVDREVALMSALMDRPDVVAVSHDIVTGRIGTRLRRRVLHAGGVLADEFVDLDHVCPSCALREDAIPTIAALGETGQWASVLLLLPPAAEILPASQGLTAQLGPGGDLHRFRLGATVSLVAADRVVADLLGSDDLAERLIALADGDERTVGEALLGQVPVADLIVLADGESARPAMLRRARALVDAVRARDSRRFDCAHGPWLAQAMTWRHHEGHGQRRAHPGGFTAGIGGDRSRNGIWSLDLRSDRPMHPDRLLRAAETIANGPRTVRARFWVPNRPDSMCAMLGAGRQLTVGLVEDWGEAVPDTRMLVVGTGPGAEEVKRAFEECLLTPAELDEGPAVWLTRADPLAAYLG